MFDREYLKKEMEKLDGLVTERIDFYLIGGSSMSFQNLKDATKDIDVVVRSEHDLKLLRDALVRMGYSVPSVRDHTNRCRQVLSWRIGTVSDGTYL